MHDGVLESGSLGQAPLVRKSTCQCRRAASRSRRTLAEWNAKRTATKTAFAVNAAMHSGVMLMRLTLVAPPMLATIREDAAKTM